MFTSFFTVFQGSFARCSSLTSKSRFVSLLLGDWATGRTRLPRTNGGLWILSFHNVICNVRKMPMNSLNIFHKLTVHKIFFSYFSLPGDKSIRNLGRVFKTIINRERVLNCYIRLHFVFLVCNAFLKYFVWMIVRNFFMTCFGLL